MPHYESVELSDGRDQSRASIHGGAFLTTKETITVKDGCKSWVRQYRGIIL